MSTRGSGPSGGWPSSPRSASARCPPGSRSPGSAGSGTTLLHRLLGCDPDVAFLPTWQAFHPVPPPGPDERRAATVARIEAIAAADPDALAVHLLDADAPEEEVFLLQLSFASMLFVLPCPLPSYNAWLGASDHTDAYRFALDVVPPQRMARGDAAGSAPRAEVPPVRARPRGWWPTSSPTR